MYSVLSAVISGLAWAKSWREDPRGLSPRCRALETLLFAGEKAPPPLIASDLGGPERQERLVAFARQFRIDCQEIRHIFPPGVPVGLQVSAINIGGVPCQMIASAIKPPPNKALVWFHGGGIVGHSAETYVPIGLMMAAEHMVPAGGCVVLVDYSLRPEAEWPLPVNEGIAVFDGLVSEHGLAPTSVALAGDSGGGALCLLVMQRLIHREGLSESRDLTSEAAVVRLPGCGLFISPMADMTFSNLNEVPSGDAVIHSPAMCYWVPDCCVPFGSDASDPTWSALHGSFRGFPPSYFVTGDSDMLKHMVTECAAKVAEDNPENSKLLVAPHMFHCHLMFPHLFSESRRDFDEALQFVVDILVRHASDQSAVTENAVSTL